jgi:hypothetical protein
MWEVVPDFQGDHAILIGGQVAEQTDPDGSD